MMKCKKALEECNGDMEAAVDYLRKRPRTALKADRDRLQGSRHRDRRWQGRGGLPRLRDRLRFRQRRLQGLRQRVGRCRAQCRRCRHRWAAGASIGGKSVEDAITEQIQKMGENMQLAKVVAVDGDAVIGYNHGGRAATFVAGAGDAAILKNIAMHAAAASPAPIALNKDDVDQDTLDKEREILMQSDEILAKPEAIRQIVEGKLGRFYKEYVLLEQELPVDGDGKQSVGGYLKDKGASVSSFVRLDVG